ncbi:MAG: flagellar basal body L-ring protein FlgH [Polaromonas sp.]|nr:flagellar basal body L-ring protein FlgH [Polaromonas sp.]
MSRLLLTLLPLILLSGCETLQQAPLAHTPEFAPVYPVTAERTRQATGGIYVSRVSDSWFGRSRNFQVGDVVTVVLNEATQAARTQNNALSRVSKNDVLPTGLLTSASKMGGILGGLPLTGGSNTSTGAGTADQTASLTGTVSVTVIDVLPNGNLVLRGEKQLALSEGTEVIQVAGVIRPEDISPNNMVQSRRLVNAQITYRGTGDLAAATRAGWGTSALLKFWPF